jgi:phosphoribosylformylglycinamidine synthase
MRAAIIIAPGINRERDMAMALEQASGVKPIMVWHRDADLPVADLIVIPGGFSYGDYLRPGAMAANSPILRAVVARATQGVPVLGVCNGFQVLTETGLLPGALLSNASLRFVCRDVHLRVDNSQTLFASGYETGQVIRVPVAHHDGNYFADDDTLNRLEQEDRIAFRYCSADGDIDPAANPNGAIRNIAGIYNEAKTVLGLMPHPENAVRPDQGGTDGRGLFDGIVQALAA